MVLIAELENAANSSPDSLVDLLLAQIASFGVLPPITNPILIGTACLVQTAPSQQWLLENAEFIGRGEISQRLIDFPALADGKHVTFVVDVCRVEGQVEYQSISRGIVTSGYVLPPCD
ncbi:hypothetical protein [Rhizobium leguminosarum]|uniref:hypothetical protein n=1 Tax=Rhizobium leguminosarum TaxID=384 RepID=UPI000485A39E|nr:hypothetical protein [Rhizobium leguminosarum]WFT86823.1 hypothetical protein QA638_04180 [Rhizobium leguminosarum]